MSADTHDEQLTKLVDLTKESRFVMLNEHDQDGHIVSRPMSRQEVDLSADL